MLVTLKLTKHVGANTIGEVCSFSPDAAAHIMKHNGGTELARFDELTHRFDVASGKAVPLSKK